MSDHMQGNMLGRVQYYTGHTRTLSRFLATWSRLAAQLRFFPLPTGGRRSPAVACWASDHWVASSNPLRGKFRH